MDNNQHVSASSTSLIDLAVSLEQAAGNLRSMARPFPIVTPEWDREWTEAWITYCGNHRQHDQSCPE